MDKIKPLKKKSLLKSLLRALGIDRDSAVPLLFQAEPQPSVSMGYVSHTLRQTALQEAEQARAKAIIELQRKNTV